jgi:hypothetical protein
MRSTFSLLGIIIVLAIGYFIYTRQIGGGAESESLPRQANLIAVRQDLLSLGQAERLYQAANGRYASMDQLRGSGMVSSIPDGRRWGYAYSVESHGPEYFRITATPLDPSSGFQSLSMDEAMQIQD